MKPSRRLPEHTSVHWASRDCWCDPVPDEPGVWIHRDLEKSAAVCEGDLIFPDPPHPDRGFPERKSEASLRQKA